ncbi:MAG TPA: hypothetical protein VGI87_13330 [Solirubrobacteraceae bacterium]|jgi:hypothetical protein
MGDAQLIVMIGGVHLLALGLVAVLMIPALRDGQWPSSWRSDGESDEGWGRGPRRPPKPPEPPRGGIPLLDAEPARVRLRDNRRLSDLLPPRQRRPAREPQRTPVRVGR